MSRLLPFLVLFACKGDPATGSPTGTDGPTPTDAPPTGDCLDPQEALIERDVDEAHDRYQACLIHEPDNPTYLFGKAFTGLVLLVDGPQVGALMAHCGETGPFGPGIYGPGGILDDYEDAYTSHTVTLTSEVVEDGVATSFDALGGAEWAEVDVWSGGDILDIDIANDFSWDQQLSIEFDVNDVYQDGSNVPLSDGLVIDVANMWSYPNYYTDCDSPGNDCDFTSGDPSGTITVNSWGTSPGDAVDVDFDFHLPASCDSCTAASAHFVGSFQGSVSDVEDLVFDLPLATSIDQSACAHGLCDDDTAGWGVIAEICPAATMGDAWDDARDLAAAFRSLADDFDAAAAHADLSWEFPHEAIFVFTRDTPMNQTDAKLLAGGLRTAGAALDLATGFTVIDPSATFSSLDGTYSDGDWDGLTCGTTSYQGISMDTLRTQAEAHFGNHSTQADFAAARTELRDGLATAADALDLQPTGDGVFDFSETPGWTGAMRADADAVIASLDGTDGTLSSAPIWEVTLDNFFSDVPDAGDLRSEAGVTEIFAEYLYQDCEPGVEVPEDAAVWLLEDNRAFPITEAKIDSEQVPILFDENGYDAIESSSGFPRFFTPEIRDYFEQWD